MTLIPNFYQQYPPGSAPLGQGQPQPGFAPIGPSPNAYADEFAVYTNDQLKTMFDAMSTFVGKAVRGKQDFCQLIYGQHLSISNTTASNPGVPVCLNADIPVAPPMRFYFQDPVTFVSRITAIPGPVRLKADGEAEPAYFDGAYNPLDFIYVDVKREGANDLLTTEPVPLSAICGTAKLGYFLSLAPIVMRGTSLLFTCSLIPPGWPDTQNPPFVSRVGSLHIQLHCERWIPFGGPL